MSEINAINSVIELRRAKIKIRLMNNALVWNITRNLVTFRASPSLLKVFTGFVFNCLLHSRHVLFNNRIYIESTLISKQLRFHPRSRSGWSSSVMVCVSSLSLSRHYPLFDSPLLVVSI